MAEGRMLKKVICESPRLAALKNDTHRLIYTWLIPHLDVEGRHSADARIVKSHVAPILDHITHKIVAAALVDMATNDLITLYTVDGKQFLELQRFSKHQILREGREKKSDIPPSTDGVPTECRRSTAQQVKIREVKIREANAREEEGPSLSKEAFLKKYQELGEDISTLFTDQRQQRQIALFVESHIKNGNLQAIIHCLESLLSTEKKNTVINPKAFLEKVFAVENGNFNAAEHEKRSAEFKKQTLPGGFTRIGEIAVMSKGEP